LGNWWRLDELPTTSESALYLCREPAIGNHYRYFFAEIRDSRIFRESPVDPMDLRRLRFGMDLVAGRRLVVKVHVTPESCSFHLWRRLPKEETRVMDALTTQVMGEDFRVSYTFEMPY